MRKILTFIGSGGHGGNVSKWRKFEFHHTGINYEKIVSHRGKAYHLNVDLPVLDSAINSITSGEFDAIFCETPEAMLFRFVAERRGLRQIPFIILGCDVTFRLESLNQWLKKVYSCDYMHEFMKHPLNLWLHTTKLQRKLYVDAGVPESQLTYSNSSVRVVEILFSPIRKLAVAGSGLSPKKTEFLGLIAAPGNNNRDFNTLFEAISGVDVRCAVIGGNQHLPPPPYPPNVIIYDNLPLNKYLTAIRDSLFVVIPVKDGNEILNGGQMTAFYAARLGKSCVATRCDAIEECVVDGETGFLVDIGDANAMRESILRLASNSHLRRKMGERAIAHEKQLSMEGQCALLGMFNRATS